MMLSLGECFKFVQVVLLYKLDVTYLKYISYEVSVPSADKIMLVDMYQKGDIRLFDYWLEKLSSAFKPHECKVFSFTIEKSSRFFNRSVAKSLSILIYILYISSESIQVFREWLTC